MHSIDSRLLSRLGQLLFCGFLITTVFAGPALVAQTGTGAADDSRAPDWLDTTDRHQVEIFLSSLFANSATEGSFGLRGALQLKRRFFVEGSASRIDDGRNELFIVDASAKYYLRDKKRTDFYVLGGPGIFYSSDLDAEELTLHVGFGAEFALGRRLYLRPELRGRFLAEDVDANFGDLALGLGWRFGRN